MTHNPTDGYHEHHYLGGLPLQFKHQNKLKTAPDIKDVPPGQFVTEKFPVLTYGPTPNISKKDWRLRIFGEVENPIELDWDQFLKLKQDLLEVPFHCVTQWSRLENTWEGVLITTLAKLVEPKPNAKHMIAQCYGDYSTNIPIEIALDGMSMLACKHDGENLTPEHGGPLRTVVPARYGWKSAKWVTGIEFSNVDMPGFWEVRGYHNNGDFNKEERFWPELS